MREFAAVSVAAPTPAAPTEAPYLLGPQVLAPYLLTTDAYAPTPRESHLVQVLPEHELLWCERGTVTVDVGARSWLLPVGTGLWIPAGVERELRASEGAFLWRTFVDPERAGRAAPGALPGAAPSRPALLEANPAFRALLAHLRRTPMDARTRIEAQRVCLELVTRLDWDFLAIPRPRDPRLEPMVRWILEHPEDDRAVEAWARCLGMSARTLGRLFLEDVGIGCGRWRQLVRIRAAADLIARGSGVAEAGRALGYAGVSAFVAAFRRVTGRTPGALAGALSHSDAWEHAA